MFGKRKRGAELDPPPMAGASREAIEILRAWAAPGAPQQVVLRTCWKDPAAWGLFLVDVARHAAAAYGRDGRDPQEVLQRIRAAFDAEWSSPTSDADDLTEES